MTTERKIKELYSHIYVCLLAYYDTYEVKRTHIDQGQALLNKHLLRYTIYDQPFNSSKRTRIDVNIAERKVQKYLISGNTKPEFIPLIDKELKLFDELGFKLTTNHSKITNQIIEDWF